MTLQITNLIFVGLADIENEEFVALVEAQLQFARGNFWHVQIHIRLLLAADPAELVVVDELVNCGVRSAHGAVGILAELQLAKLRRERIEQKQSADQQLATAYQQFDGSIACNEPMMPGSTPSTPPSAQEGTKPGGGGCGYRQR